MPVKNRFAELHDQITAWRRDMHEHPELLFDTVIGGAILGQGSGVVVLSRAA